MENLKIRVNSADESKEAQELFLGLGYVKENCFWSGYSDYPIELRTRDGGYLDFKLNAENAIERKEITLSELRAMVDQDQDEPFLTPECTLNYQNAEKDNVNHPSHYTQGKVECIDALESATIGKSGIEAVCVANVIKYLWRYEEKNGAEDVKKAKFYLNRLLDTLENNNG